MKSFFWITLPLALLALTANAQVTQAPKEVQATAPAPLATPATALSPADQGALDAARNLVRTASLWNHPLDWKETGSSTAEIVAHIKAAMGDKAPLIEVRGQDANRLTFVLKQAPLGPTLSSLAELANAQLWVFSGRLVLSPESALSADERAAIERRAGGEWKQSRNAGGMGWNAKDEVNRVSLSIIATDLKERLAAKGQPVPPTPATPTFPTGTQRPTPYELPFDELRPTSQKVLQDIFDTRYEGIPDQGREPLTLNSLIIVSLTEMSSNTLLSLRKRDSPSGEKGTHLANWYVNSRPSNFLRAFGPRSLPPVKNAPAATTPF